MADEHADAVTRVLKAVGEGDVRASEELLPLVYEELRRLAQARMAKTPPGNTLQPTALVHEAYLRLIGDGGDKSWNSRGHFFGAAAQAMRQILVEQARRKASLKRGGDRQRANAADAEPVFEPPSDDIVAIDEALTTLERQDPRKAKIVMLKYFAGLTTEETAAAMNISVPTVEREWRFARVLLYSQLKDDQAAP